MYAYLPYLQIRCMVSLWRFGLLEPYFVLRGQHNRKERF